MLKLRENAGCGGRVEAVTTLRTVDDEAKPTLDPDVEPTLAVGVGPWPGEQGDWPTDPRYDRDLLEHGDARNVVDEFRYWTVEAIVAELDTRRHGFSVAIEN